MEPNKILRIGQTLSIKDNDIISCVSDIISMNGNFFQIFLSDPSSFSFKRYSKLALLQLNKLVRQNNLKFVIHGHFMLNFCNPVSTKKHINACNMLIKDMNDSVLAGSIGVVIHMGKRLKMELSEALNNYVVGVKYVLDKSDKESILILETGAGVGTEICSSISDLGCLRNMFSDEEKKRIKICIDTCHIYSFGYDIGNPIYTKFLIEYIDFHLGWTNVICVHLNNSKMMIGTKKDRHADLVNGYIESNGLSLFVKECFRRNVPMVLETPCDMISSGLQIETVKEWCL